MTGIVAIVSRQETKPSLTETINTKLLDSYSLAIMLITEPETETEGAFRFSISQETETEAQMETRQKRKQMELMVSFMYHVRFCFRRVSVTFVRVKPGK